MEFQITGKNLFAQIFVAKEVTAAADPAAEVNLESTTWKSKADHRHQYFI